jgi:hypothetical protein
VDDEIAKYFTQIYKGPNYRRESVNYIDFNVDGEDGMQIDTNNYDSHHSVSGNVTSYTREEVIEAMKSCNFNKVFGPDCFDANILHSNN